MSRAARLGYRFLGGMAAWVALGTAVLVGIDVLSVDRLAIVTLVGFLVVAALVLPANPPRRVRHAVALAAIAGLIGYAALVVNRVLAIV